MYPCPFLWTLTIRLPQFLRGSCYRTLVCVLCVAPSDPESRQLWRLRCSVERLSRLLDRTECDARVARLFETL